MKEGVLCEQAMRRHKGLEEERLDERKLEVRAAEHVVVQEKIGHMRILLPYGNLLAAKTLDHNAFDLSANIYLFPLPFLFLFPGPPAGPLTGAASLTPTSSATIPP